MTATQVDYQTASRLGALDNVPNIAVPEGEKVVGLEKSEGLEHRKEVVLSVDLEAAVVNTSNYQGIPGTSNNILEDLLNVGLMEGDLTIEGTKQEKYIKNTDKNPDGTYNTDNDVFGPLNIGILAAKTLLGEDYLNDLARSFGFDGDGEHPPIYDKNLIWESGQDDQALRFSILVAAKMIEKLGGSLDEFIDWHVGGAIKEYRDNPENKANRARYKKVLYSNSMAYTAIALNSGKQDDPNTPYDDSLINDYRRWGNLPGV